MNLEEGNYVLNRNTRMLKKLAKEFAEKELEPIAGDAERMDVIRLNCGEAAQYGLGELYQEEEAGDYKSLASVVEEFCKRMRGGFLASDE